MLCPDCGHDNIEGVDDCEQCGQSLVGSQRLGLPTSDFEQRVAMQQVQALVPNRPVALAETATVREAIRTMVDGHFGCVFVEREGRLVGIFTERDVLNRVAGDLAHLDRPLADFATADPESVASNDTIGYTLQAMDSGGYRHVPVVDEDGHATGIVSVRDVMQYVHRRFEELEPTS